jgi:hypothetical protein
LREAGGQETRRFDAILTHHGRPAVYVWNGGEGGANRYEPHDRTGVHDDVREFEEFASRWNAGSEFAGIMDGDALVDRLIEVALLNRSRRVLFLLDKEQFWDDGVHHAVLGISDRTAALDYVRREYPNRNARVWNRNVSDWVPLD